MRKSLFFTAFCAFFFFSVLAQHRNAILLPSARFSTGNNAEWAAASFDDRSWKEIATGRVWQEQGFAGYHGYAWYRIHVVIPSSLRKNGLWKDSLRLFLAHVNDVDETWLNGVRINKTGSFPGDDGGYVSRWPAVREYHISAGNGAIHWDADNVIAIKVYDGGGTGGIFMGLPYIDMLERPDGVTVAVAQDSIRYSGEEAVVPVMVTNRFNTRFGAGLSISVRDAASGKVILQKTVVLSEKPFGSETVRLTVPNRSGIELSYVYKELAADHPGGYAAPGGRDAVVPGPGSGVELAAKQTIPYILTPKPGDKPHINSAAAFGAHPGSPFLFRIAATGRHPLAYRAEGLPEGLQIDESTGLITGVAARPGAYPVHVVVSNRTGKAEQHLLIRIGKELALTPQMGWNSWNCWGIEVSADKVRASAQALIDKGLMDYGWSYINIDDGWEAPTRAADSSIVPNEKFPDMKGLGSWLHEKGLKFGIYSSPGPRTCGGYLGSYLNERKDAAAYSSWGIDYLKYDWCSYDDIARGNTSQEAYIKPYLVMDSALAEQRRDILYSLCQYGMGEVWKWGTQVHAQSWRTTEDIEDTWRSLSGIGFHQSDLAAYAGPGHWNDPDMMIVGQVGWGTGLHPSRLTPDEQYTHVSLWCMLSAPLLIGCDLSRLDNFTLNLLTNPEVLALDQDILGKAGHRVSEKDSIQVWIKELADGSKAIAVFNTSLTYRPVNVSWASLGLKGAQAVRDVWRERDLGIMADGYKTLVAPHGVALIRLSGIQRIHTADFNIGLMKASGTAAILEPASLPGFSFVPEDSLASRQHDGVYHLGDIDLRLKTGEGSWQSYSSAAHRQPVEMLDTKGDTLAAADLAPTFPAVMPLDIRRYWQIENGRLTLRFVLKNKTDKPVTIGALGIPMVFNNILEGKTLEEAHQSNVLYDPYTGLDGGYLQVTRLNGEAPSMIVTGLPGSGFEAYNPILNDPTPRNAAFEGFYEWMVHSAAYADSDWKKAEPWNAPTSYTLEPGQQRSYGVQFLAAGKPSTIEAALARNGHPVAVGIPGYVVAEDVTAKLFLKYPHTVKSISIEPAGAMQLTETTPVGLAGLGSHRSPISPGLKAYEVHGLRWGRTRVTIRYDNGVVQTVHYKVIKPEREVISDYGHFLTTKQWYVNKDDSFYRSPSVISYDNEKKEQVTQDNRVWIAGLSDEAGAGSWLGAMMKQLVLPSKDEVSKLDGFIDQTLWGHIQYNSGGNQYGVRKSLFYYEPDSMPAGTYSSSIHWKTWSAWPKKEAGSPGRSYNYPHVAAAYWVMYRLARYHNGLAAAHPWEWYLTNAYQTAMAMVHLAPYYAQFGQMEGSVFYFILKDLRTEGMTDMADKLEAEMKKRAIHWKSLDYPFGSEMPWDSTGQEEVYIWSYFFGYMDKAEVTLNAILGYMPTLPSWAYNGNARRYWDFLYAGKLSRIERMIHHYGSELNAIPVLAEYRRRPEELYLLRVGYGGLLGGISNITEEGFAPCAFHSFPSTLKNDALSGDYGSGFYGYAVNTATYLTYSKELGWLGFGGNVSAVDGWINMEVTTAAQSSVYIAPAGLWLKLSSGKISRVSYRPSTHEVRLELEAGDVFTDKAYLTVEQPAKIAGIGMYGLKGAEKERGMYVLPLGAAATTYKLTIQ